jgi:vitamin B12 transporter
MSSSILCLARRRIRRASLLATTVLTSLAVAGAYDTADAQPTTLPEIVVTSPTTIPTPISQIGSSVTVITAQDIERDQRRTVSDALSTVPGLNVVQTGGPGGDTSVFMRGTNSNHVKVLIDGIDVSDPSSANRTFNFGHLLTADIERIEVLRGPQSGLYGSEAIGGVISITTKKGEGPPKVTGMAEAGSFGTFNQTASLSGSDGGFNYSFNAAHMRVESTPVTPLELLPPGRKRNNDTYNNWTYSSRLGYDVNEHLSFNWVGRYTDSKLFFTGDDFTVFPPVPAAERSIAVAHQFFTRGEAAMSLLDDRLKSYFGIAYTDTWNWNKEPDTAFGLTAPTINKGDRVKVDWRNVATVAPGHNFVWGVEREDERIFTATEAGVTGNTGTYLELQSNFYERFFLVANARLDDNDSFGRHATWRVTPSFIIPYSETKLKGSVGTGFKAPSLNQLFVDLPAFGFFANPNLQPEESFGWDAGFEQPLFGDWFRYGMTYFHNDITNLITFISDPVTFTSTLINVGQAETKGVEMFAMWNVIPQFRLRGDYTHVRTIDVDTQLELLRRPRDKWSVTAIYTPIEQFQLSATVLHVGPWIDANRNFTIPRLTNPGYTIVNLAAHYWVNEQVKLFARVDNLFDLEYQNPTGFERPGVGVYGGIRFANR